MTPCILFTRPDYFLATMTCLCTADALEHMQLLFQHTSVTCITAVRLTASHKADPKPTTQTRTSCSPSDIVHLLLLADIDLKVSVALVDANNLVLIHLVACPTEELASLLDAL